MVFQLQAALISNMLLHGIFLLTVNILMVHTPTVLEFVVWAFESIWLGTWATMRLSFSLLLLFTIKQTKKKDLCRCDIVTSRELFESNTMVFDECKSVYVCENTLERKKNRCWRHRKDILNWHLLTAFICSTFFSTTPNLCAEKWILYLVSLSCLRARFMLFLVQ